jgi:CRISPR system Cascade subunit CasC
MGIVEFNSACFYRYAVIDRDQLVANLRGDAELADKAIVAFLQGSIDALPTGRQNSSAAHNPPDYVEVVVNDGLPRSLANAFEQPARAGESLVGASIDKLRQYAAELAETYGADGMRSRFLCTRPNVEGRVSRSELVAWLTAELKGGA